MLAKRIGELPAAGQWIFEPKWDGFRALVFHDGDEIFIQSRDKKSLNRYFPELLGPLRSQLPARSVVDGEIVVARNGALDFEALQLRIHPAASRVSLLSRESPASIVLFDLLSEGNQDLRSLAFRERRMKLESLFSTVAPPIHLTPATTDLSVAADWFRRFEGAGLDGVVAKAISGKYESNTTRAGRRSRLRTYPGLENPPPGTRSPVPSAQYAARMDIWPTRSRTAIRTGGYFSKLMFPERAPHAGPNSPLLASILVGDA